MTVTLSIVGLNVASSNLKLLLQLVPLLLDVPLTRPPLQELLQVLLLLRVPRGAQQHEQHKSQLGHTKA